MKKIKGILLWSWSHPALFVAAALFSAMIVVYIIREQEVGEEMDKMKRRDAKTPPYGSVLLARENYHYRSWAIEKFANDCERSGRWVEALYWWDEWEPQVWGCGTGAKYQAQNRLDRIETCKEKIMAESGWAAYFCTVIFWRWRWLACAMIISTLYFQHLSKVAKKSPARWNPWVPFG